MNSISRRIRVDVSGAVQGVGFRPFVYRLATGLGLSGFVQNEPEGVEIELEGTPASLYAFLARLASEPPPLARVERVRTHPIPPTSDMGRFVVRESAVAGPRTVFIAPDYATCDACLRELDDPADRRYRYPFINCTHCGPRYTIIRDLPYDRARTAMADFPMCATCRAEYESPLDRRFHAEAVCCPACGPSLRLAARDGRTASCTDPIEAAVQLITAGRVVAVKGLGGFHLACDAANAEAVALLRQRKRRDMKPFAVMARDLDTARELCHVGDGTAGLLACRERPIVLLRKRHPGAQAEAVAPRNARLGVMLPYTPLHHLLMGGPFRALVMTSGNVSDEPIVFENDDALDRLRDVADWFLLHDRAICIRTDDSVAQVCAGRPRFVRRSRGYTPFPVALPGTGEENAVLAVGAELNTAVCLTRGGQAFVSQHIGDLRNTAAYESFLQAIAHLRYTLGAAPSAVACDLHPGYASTRYARKTGLPCLEVQHHHAHIASVLAEAGRTDKVMGVAMDGMGWGDDGALWGGEFLVCDLDAYTRAAHLAAVPQPGGDAAAVHTGRMAWACLHTVFGEGATAVAHELMPWLPVEETRLLARLVARGVNCPWTTSAGRLFDAASGLLGVCAENTHHGRAPMELEALAHEAEEEEGFYNAPVATGPDGLLVVETPRLIRGLVEDIRRGTAAAVCAARFHNSLARAVGETCDRIRETTGLETVALGGGVFVNAFLLERAKSGLEQRGFEVLLNERVPPGDGGISLGQAAVAAGRLACA